jgi:hypothetical protein
MGTPAQIGKHQFNAAINDARQANERMRNILRRLISASPSERINSLAGQIAMEVGDNDSALNKLFEIGKTLKK